MALETEIIKVVANIANHHLLYIIALTTATAQDGDTSEKIIMTSILVTMPATRVSPSKSLFGRSRPKTKLKIVLMPKSEYSKYFAHDKSGAYIGTEAEQSWTEEELDERYGAIRARCRLR